MDLDNLEAGGFELLSASVRNDTAQHVAAQCNAGSSSSFWPSFRARR
jgi:hypothetical protein